MDVPPAPPVCPALDVFSMIRCVMDFSMVEDVDVGAAPLTAISSSVTVLKRLVWKNDDVRG